jgi:hypothetical protein
MIRIGTLVLVFGICGCGDPPAMHDRATQTPPSGGGNPKTPRPADPTPAPLPGSRTVKLTLAEFDVPPGGEVYRCQDFMNPFGGDMELDMIESHMSLGSHHMLLYFKDGAGNGSLEPCSGVEFHETAFATQKANEYVRYPDGVAAFIPQGRGFRAQSHYINATRVPVKGKVEITLYTAPPGSKRTHAGVFFLSDELFLIPPLSGPTTVSMRCKAPADIYLIGGASHMHKHGIRFTAKTQDRTIYETTEWADPPSIAFKPEVLLRKGDPIDFNCTYLNNTDQALTFGESAERNEMCIFSGTYYPIPASGDPTFTCLF